MDTEEDLEKYWLLMSIFTKYNVLDARGEEKLKLAVYRKTAHKWRLMGALASYRMHARSLSNQHGKQKKRKVDRSFSGCLRSKPGCLALKKSAVLAYSRSQCTSTLSNSKSISANRAKIDRLENRQLRGVNEHFAISVHLY